MGRKNVIKNGHKMLDSQDISITSTSSETNISNLDKASIHVAWTGDAVGVLTVEVTNDSVESNSPVWRELNMGGVIAMAGVADFHELIFNELPFNAIRLVYTTTSGTGSMNATLSAYTTGA